LIKKVNRRHDPISWAKKEDNMGVKNNVLKLMIVLAAVSFAGHAIAVEYQVPESLDQMINVTRRLVNELKRLDPNTQSEMYQKKRLLIAYWVALASEKRISNCNDTELVWNPFACRNLGEARKKWGIKPNTEWNDRSNKNEMIAKWAWENQAGNCDENSNVVYYILKQAGVTDTLRILWSDCWHGFVVWGVQEGADLNRPLTWNPDALVLDSWTGKVLTPYEAHNDKYIGNGGINPIEDMTLGRDNTASAWSSLMTPADTPSSNNNEIPDSPRYTCYIKDLNIMGLGHNCQSWVKEGASHKDIIVANEDWKKTPDLWSPPPCYKKLRFDECPIVMQDARDVCTSWRNNGNSLSGRNQHGTTVNANRNQGMFYDLEQGSYGGGRFCLTAEEATKIENDPHTVKITPVGIPCSK
jgi:hypothetical protein